MLSHHSLFIALHPTIYEYIFPALIKNRRNKTKQNEIKTARKNVAKLKITKKLKKEKEIT